MPCQSYGLQTHWQQQHHFKLSMPVAHLWSFRATTNACICCACCAQDFGEHGREFISSELGLKLLQVLADEQQLKQYVGSGKRLARLTAILQQTVLKILPMENTHGRDLVESGKLCERKNGRGVDTNRNWDIDWGKKEKDYDPNEEYPGKAPHSEPEVQVLLALAKEFKPHVWLNVHSGMYALFTPYDHKPHVPNTTDARAALRMLQRIKETICTECVVGSGGHSVGYLAHGTATDYMFEVLGVPMPFTWEIYGDATASFDDCFKMFNPLGQDNYDRVVTMWVKALLQLLELLPTHPATWPVFKAAGMDRDSSRGGEQAQAAKQRSQEQQQADPSGGGPGSTADGAPDKQQQGEQQQEKDGDEGVSRRGSNNDSSSSRTEAAEETISIRRAPGSPGVVGGNGSSRSSSWGVLRQQQLLPLLVGLGGMVALVYLVTRRRSEGLPYARVPVRTRK
eukprot:GHRR01020461.1.p1 GENE.GHRR01020461.1~~GHRR01020461.1.p1  ORF type:complete len:453 (+),score=174.98 GHRR01020461.1:125-1483(+)